MEEKELQVFGSPGGKTHIVKKLLRLVPEHNTYIEPFAGGAALYWKKKPCSTEVLNDKDSEIAFAYNFVKHVTDDQIRKLNAMNWKSNKSLFFKLKDSKAPSKPTERFYRFYYTLYHSYGLSRKTFGYKERSPADFKKLLKEKERLKNTRIFHGDYDLVVKKFDSKDAFIYLDPPYPNEWPGPSGINAWGEKDVREIHELLKNVKGKWLLSINNLDWIRKIFSDFHVSKILVPRKFRKNDPPKYELLISNYEIKNLTQEFPGIYLNKPLAEKVWSGESKVIIKKENFKNFKKLLETPLYYMDDDFSYGILKLVKQKFIDKKDFKKLREFHNLEEGDLFDKNDKVYLYEFEIIDRFEDPKTVNIEYDEDGFVKETNFLSCKGSPISGHGLEPIWIFGKKKKGKKLNSDDVKQLIEDVKKYDPSKADDEQIKKDWQTVSDWYEKKEDKEAKFSKETILNLAKLIYNEIKKRKLDTDFNNSELFKIVSRDSIIMEDWRNLKFLDNFDDFIVIKDCISLIGSTVTKDHKPNDADLLIRMKEPENQFLKRAVETRIIKMVPKEMEGRIHFVWGEKEGPHDSFIPLFDLQFKRIRPVKRITMIQDKSSKIHLMKPYTLQKPLGSAYYDLDKFIEVLT